MFTKDSGLVQFSFLIQVGTISSLNLVLNSFIEIFFLGESHGQRSLAGYSPWGHTESDMTEVTQHTHGLRKCYSFFLSTQLTYNAIHPFKAHNSTTSPHYTWSIFFPSENYPLSSVSIQPLIYFIYIYKFAILGISYKWNHTIWSFWTGSFHSTQTVKSNTLNREGKNLHPRKSQSGKPRQDAKCLPVSCARCSFV